MCVNAHTVILAAVKVTFHYSALPRLELPTGGSSPSHECAQGHKCPRRKICALVLLVAFTFLRQGVQRDIPAHCLVIFSSYRITPPFLKRSCNVRCVTY